MSAEQPTTSVAEFRAAAWQAYNRNKPVSVALGVYLTWCALVAGLTILAIGLAGLAVSPESVWVALAGAVLTALVTWRLVRVFRRAAAAREALVARSREVDALAASGQIPLAPPGWTEPVRPGLHERTA